MAYFNGLLVQFNTKDIQVKLSVRNKLKGTVKNIESGPIYSKITLSLDASPTVMAVVTKEVIDELDPKEGAAAVAIIKSSSVMLGVCHDGAGCDCEH